MVTIIIIKDPNKNPHMPQQTCSKMMVIHQIFIRIEAEADRHDLQREMKVHTLETKSIFLEKNQRKMCTHHEARPAITEGTQEPALSSSLSEMWILPRLWQVVIRALEEST